MGKRRPERYSLAGIPAARLGDRSIVFYLECLSRLRTEFADFRRETRAGAADVDAADSSSAATTVVGTLLVGAFEESDCEEFIDKIMRSWKETGEPLDSFIDRRIREYESELGRRSRRRYRCVPTSTLRQLYEIAPIESIDRDMMHRALLARPVRLVYQRTGRRDPDGVPYVQARFLPTCGARARVPRTAHRGRAARRPPRRRRTGGVRARGPDGPGLADSDSDSDLAARGGRTAPVVGGVS